MQGSVLVFGRSGQLARELARARAPAGVRLEFVGREEFDLLGRDGGALIGERAPMAVINAAAYTAVDRAETERDAAFRLNRDVPGELARACARRAVPFVHFSTDYVFDGEQETPYRENDARRPLSVYGRSKAEGEDAVLQAGGPAAVVRTSWVFSASGSNFVKTMLRLAADRDEVRVVCDQRGRPTWATDLADGALLLAGALTEGNARARGVFHLAGEGAATWADFAEGIFALSAERGGPTARVRPIATEEFPTPARRPRNSHLCTEKLEATLNWRPRPWRAGLAACFDQMETLG